MSLDSLSDDYAAAIRYLYSRINYEQTPPEHNRRRELTLEQMQWLLERLGQPQASVPVVHIAGTKGKGSTAAMISSALSSAGYRTGLYTSPHLSCLDERYVVDGIRCSPAELVALAHAVRPAVDEIDRELKASRSQCLTFFEVTTAMAWLYFASKQVDLAVVEVGLGGRLDSTNLCRPLVTVITSISLDHTRLLGNTVEAIAREKAGIIKPGIPVVSGVLAHEARDVVREVARERCAPLYELGIDFEITNLAIARDGAPPQFDYSGIVAGCERRLTGVQIGLLGRHQALNAGMALASLMCLGGHNFPFSEPAFRAGLAAARCPARIQIVRRDPFVILDTAHNDASIAALVETVNDYFPSGRRTLVFAASRDKDVPGMMRQLVTQFDTIVLTQFLNNPRAVPIVELEGITRNILASTDNPRAKEFICCRTPNEAWSRCQQQLRPGDLACVSGSFFLAAEMQRLVSPNDVAIAVPQ